MRIVSIWVLAFALVGFVLTQWACEPRVPSVEIREEEEPERSALLVAPDGWRNEIETLPADQIKRLRMEWGQPQRFVYKTVFDRCPGLRITGKLLLLQEDGRTLRPVQKPLLLGVAMCVRPDVRKDWTQGVGRRDPSKSGYMVCSLEGELLGKPPCSFPGNEPLQPPPPGVFAAVMPRNELYTEPGTARTFQVGLCLGELFGEQIVWQIIPQSVQMINIPGPKLLSYTHQLINACPQRSGGDFDPIHVVRAVNRLRSLGKEKALESLRDFADIAYDSGYSERSPDPTNLDTSNRWCLPPLVTVLFPNIKNDEAIVIWQGMPFHTICYDVVKISGAFTKAKLDWPAREGILLDQPLRPTDHPLEAADALLAKLVNERFRDDYHTRTLQNHIRRQAWRSIKHLINPNLEEPPYLDPESRWKRLKEQAAALRIRWDEQKQEYVAGAKP